MFPASHVPNASQLPVPNLPRMAFQVLARTSHGHLRTIEKPYVVTEVQGYLYILILSKGKLPNMGKKQAFIVGLAVNNP
jgi:hypothetical protein